MVRRVTAPIRHALLADLPRQARTVVRVTGEDATRFLQGLLSADVGELTPGRAVPATLLTVKGKIVSEIWVLAVSEDEPWLAIPAELGEAVVAKLDDHIIMDDVELEPLPEHACVLAWRDEGSPGPAELGLDLPASVHAFESTHPLPGVLLVGPRATLEQLPLGEPATPERFTATRVERGRPAWGFEIVPDRFPPEVGFVDAVSYEKGCYLGQEPLSRIHNRGQVNRVMVRVALHGPPSTEDLPIALTDDDHEVGQLTTLAATQGLAIVRRTHAKPGTKLHAAGTELEVLSPPLGDDPGGPGRQKTATVRLGSR
jgi:folate-binding protein YgfZ